MYPNQNQYLGKLYKIINLAICEIGNDLLDNVLVLSTTAASSPPPPPQKNNHFLEEGAAVHRL